MGLSPTNWPSARHFTEALQCPPICFANPFLRDTLPAVDKLGMPLVTSGQFAYVYKLNRSDGGSWAVRCFRSYLADRQARYTALDAHFRENMLAALPRFAYEPEGLLVSGRRYPMLVMEWIKAPTLDSYLEKVLDRPEVLAHLTDEWARLITALRGQGVAHGDLQHGNILVQNGALRLVDLDGVYVPALRGWRACEVGHQHFQHPRRREDWFHSDLDNFSALSIYLSLKALVARPTLWHEHHDENLLFTKSDFQDPDKSLLFNCIRELGDEPKRLADILADACRRDVPDVPPLGELVEIADAPDAADRHNTPAGVEVVTQTREAQPLALAQTAYQTGRPAPTYATQPTYVRPPALSNPNVNTPPTNIQTLFGGPAQKQIDPSDVLGNTFYFAGQAAKAVFSKIGAFWIIFLFSSIWIRLITGFWEMFGVDAAAAFMLTFLLITLGFILYGFVRALDTQANPSQHAALAAANVPAAVAPAPLAPALPPAQPSNIPWYTQNAQTAQRQTQPLSPGARRAPDWALAAQQTNTPKPQTASGLRLYFVAHPTALTYHLEGCPKLANVAVAELSPVSSPQAAQQAGYQPCSVCVPDNWPFGGAPSAASPFQFPSPAAKAPPATPQTATPTPAPPPVIGNRDTGLYHWPDCEDAVVMDKDDEMPFVSPRAAELAGYRRCPVCKPSSRTTPNRAALPVVANHETRIYHRLDCSWAVAIKPASTEKFSSPHEAEAKGYFRCTTCRPDAPDAPPVQPLIVGHKGVKIFHRPDCPVAAQIPANQVVSFVTPTSAQAANYHRCAVCQP